MVTTAEVRRAGSYERHRAETTTLYAVVRDNVETLYAAVVAGFEGAALPPFVQRELEGYLDCGLLCRGFARLKCDSYTEQHLVAFACEGRGICPSRLGRKMCLNGVRVSVEVRPASCGGADELSMARGEAWETVARDIFRERVEGERLL